MSAAAALLAVAAAAAVAGEGPDAAPLRFHGEWRQGALLLGEAPPGSAIRFDGHDVSLTPNGVFVIGLDRDERSPARIEVRTPGAAERTLEYPVAPGDWKVQRIEGLPPQQVNPPPQVMARIRREAQEILAARRASSALEGFAQTFIWPVHGELSSVFGSQRILNGQPKQPHYGVDLAVPSGTPVRAPADGRVSLVAKNFYFTGMTLMLDHGHGVQSVFAHLSRIEVKPGQRVRQGQVIARSGASGRATGPNLHWGVSWFDNHVDPASLVESPAQRR